MIAAVLGVVQGLTEFLPISSSGHLRLIAAVFGIDEPQTLFDVCVHAGTLGAVLAVYGDTVWSLLLALRSPHWSNPRFRLGVFLIVGTIPAAVIGITFGDFLESNLASLTSVGVFLVINGGLLQLARNRGADGVAIDDLRLRHAILVGLAQSFALFRGISRSGTTITAALLLGIKRETAAEFSFLLSIPAISGAVLLKAGDALAHDHIDYTALGLGTFVAGVSGYLALRYLLRLVKKGRLYRFGWYCWGVGALAIILSLVQA